MLSEQPRKPVQLLVYLAVKDETAGSRILHFQHQCRETQQPRWVHGEQGPQADIRHVVLEH